MFAALNGSELLRQSSEGNVTAAVVEAVEAAAAETSGAAVLTPTTRRLAELAIAKAEADQVCGLDTQSTSHIRPVHTDARSTLDCQTHTPQF